jgi:hypothetical protein
VTSTRLTPTHFSLAGFAIVLLLAWFCYRPALSGDFQLDDFANLSGLQHVQDGATLLDFVLSGTAGPTGRPVALWTFALQADAWPEGAEAFLQVNILLHLLNAALLAALLFQLAQAQGAGRDRSAMIAAFAAGIWVLMPLLATSSLLVVQRMTTLSATFVIAGLLAYLLARRRIDDAPGKALVGMGASLTLATALAMLSKETGILLPVYALVLEATVLTAPRAVPGRHWRVFRGVFLGVPAAVVVVYLATQSVYPEWAVARRGFTGWERLLIEAQLLWVYLLKALVGLPSQLGIYQGPSPARSLFAAPVLLAIAAWLAVLATAYLRRRRWPLLALAVGWYLGGHLLESTVLPLEVYFEHRNYLPIIGPVYAAVAALTLAPRRVHVAGLVALPVFMALSAGFLYVFASMQGDPSTSSRYWAQRHPDSVRAVTRWVSYQLGEEGVPRALATLDDFVLRQPQHGYLRIQELNLRCIMMPAADHDPVIDELQKGLPSVEFTFTAGTMFSQLFDTVAARDCNGVDTTTVRELADRLLTNPRYAAVPGYVQFHYKLLAGIARQQGRMPDAIGYLEQAIAAQPTSELNMMMVTALGAEGEYEQARRFIEDAMQKAPLSPTWAWAWRRDLDNLRAYIDELERYSRDQN